MGKKANMHDLSAPGPKHNHRSMSREICITVLWLCRAQHVDDVISILGSVPVLRPHPEWQPGC